MIRDVTRDPTQRRAPVPVGRGVAGALRGTRRTRARAGRVPSCAEASPSLVYGAGLEYRFAGNRVGGSNPPASADHPLTAYLLVFGGAFITFALVSGMAGPGVWAGGWRWVAAAGAAAAWIVFYGTLNGLRVRRALPKLQALSAAVAQVVPSWEGDALALAVGGKRAVLVLFWSESDVASLRLSPLLADVMAVLKGRIEIGRVEVGRHPEVARDYGVVRVPTLLVLAGGTEQARFTGLVSPKRLRAALEPHL